MGEDYNSSPKNWAKFVFAQTLGKLGRKVGKPWAKLGSSPKTCAKIGRNLQIGPSCAQKLGKIGRNVNSSPKNCVKIGRSLDSVSAGSIRIAFGTVLPRRLGAKTYSARFGLFPVHARGNVPPDGSLQRCLNMLTIPGLTFSGSIEKHALSLNESVSFAPVQK